MKDDSIAMHLGLTCKVLPPESKIFQYTQFHMSQTEAEKTFEEKDLEDHEDIRHFGLETCAVRQYEDYDKTFFYFEANELSSRSLQEFFDLRVMRYSKLQFGYLPFTASNIESFSIAFLRGDLRQVMEIFIGVYGRYVLVSRDDNNVIHNVLKFENVELVSES